MKSKIIPAKVSPAEFCAITKTFCKIYIYQIAADKLIKISNDFYAKFGKKEKENRQT
jgi:hypothetical protein